MSATPICAVEWVLERVDLVLLMTVNPGFGGQKIIPYAKDKIESLADLRDELGTGLCRGRERAHEGAQRENDFFHVE